MGGDRPWGGCSKSGSNIYYLWKTGERSEGQKERPWPHMELATRHSLEGDCQCLALSERGGRMLPLIVSVSWAEQDVGRGQKNGKLPVVSMWGSSEQTGGAWLLPTLPPIPHHSRRHWGLGEFQCLLDCQSRVYPPGRDALPLSSAWGREVRTLPNPSLERSGTERDMRNSEHLIPLSPQKS